MGIFNKLSKTAKNWAGKGFSPAAIVAGEVKHSQDKYNKEQSRRSDEIWGNVEGALEDRPEYTIPDEISQYLETNQSGAEDIRGAAQEGLDIAKRQADMGMPGYDIARSQLGQSTASALRAIQEAGGGISSLGAITDLYMQEQQGLQGLAAQNAQYKAANMQNLQGQYGVYGNQMSQAAQLQGQGQLMGANYADQAYQFNEYDPYYDKLNLTSARAGYDMSQLLGQQQARAAQRSAMWSSLGQIGGAAIGTLVAPGVGTSIGANIGGQLGGQLGGGALPTAGGAF